MKLAEVMQRIEAWQRGAPIPRGETLPWPRAVAADRLIVAFVRMAGEARPWGVIAGHPGEEPAILTVPEPRDAAEFERIAHEFAALLLPHLPSRAHAMRVFKPHASRRRNRWA